jgi:hypothetical protein
MRAKFQVAKVDQNRDTSGQLSSVNLEMTAVTEKPFDADGASDDNSFARWSPSGSFYINIANPNLFDQFEVGEKYYLDFTQAEEAPAS